MHDTNKVNMQCGISVRLVDESLNVDINALRAREKLSKEKKKE